MVMEIPTSCGKWVSWKCDLDAEDLCSCLCIKYDPNMEDIITCEHFKIVIRE